jgi:D-amino peptidase
MRFLISADIEGIHGVTSQHQLSPGHFEYEAARGWMTESVVTVAQTLRAGGATEVLVADSHGNGESIRLEQMPDYVQLIRSWPRPLGMAEGVDQGQIDGVLLVGYHASASRLGGTLSHTMHGGAWQELRLNGRVASEAYLVAATAGAFGVPVLMITGDDVATAEASEQLGDLATAVVKWNYGWSSVRTLTPARARQRLVVATQEALARVGRAQALRLSGPIDIELRYRYNEPSNLLAMLPWVEQIDAHTVKCRVANMIEASKFLMFATFYGGVRTMYNRSASAS